MQEVTLVGTKHYKKFQGGLTNNIRNYIGLYQRKNDARFVKAICELHHIPVKPVV